MARDEDVPVEWPHKMHGPLVWTGQDLQGNVKSYTSAFTAEEIASIEDAVAHFRGLGLARGFASPETFPLPEALSKRLKAVADDVYNGRGFQILRGWNPANYTEEQNVIMYAGLTSHVADCRARNIDHIRDRTQDNPAGDILRPLELPVRMDFHTDIDVYDMLTMFTQSTPVDGGDQYLASIASIYNVLMQTSPRAIELMGQNWYWERNIRLSPTESTVRQYSRPLLAWENDQLQVNCAAVFVGGNEKFPLSAGAPRLSQEKKEALQALQAAAAQVQIRIRPQPGDMLFVNNYALLHARDAWTDSSHDLQKQRYVMRLWLHDEEKGWKSAVALQRNLKDNFDLPPEKQGLRTFKEWQELPRECRLKEMGTTDKDDHD